MILDIKQHVTTELITHEDHTTYESLTNSR